MNMLKDLTGMTFGKLTVIERDFGEFKKRGARWVCQCECGEVKSGVRGDSLQEGRTKSCGCLKKEQDRVNLTKHHDHKMSDTRIYHTWQGIKSRCFNPRNHSYKNYGGRGIIMCEEWSNDFNSFLFWANESGYRDNLTIERIDNNGNYEPSNCRWATPKEQSNNRRSNITLNFLGEKVTLMQISEHFEIPYVTLNERYNRGDRGFDLVRMVNNKEIPR